MAGSGDPAEAPAEVAPAEERRGRHAGRRGDHHDGDERIALLRVGLRGEGEPDGDDRGDGERRQDAQGPNDGEHTGRMPGRVTSHHGSMVPRCASAPGPFRAGEALCGAVQYPGGTSSGRRTDPARGGPGGGQWAVVHITS